MHVFDFYFTINATSQICHLTQFLLNLAFLDSLHINSTTIYDSRAVVDEAMHMHMWEDKGAEMLRVIQLNTLEDRSVHDKFQWDSAINFLQSSLQEKLEISEANLRYLHY